MSIFCASIEHIMDTDAVLKASDQGESPERNRIENDREKATRKGGFLALKAVFLLGG